MVDVNTTAQQAHENTVQQAQQWAQEARTQRATVLAILRFFGLPEHDYEALTLIQEKDAEHRAAMLKARDALTELRDLIGESQGVYGLHPNGDPSPWEELEAGGRFERLTSLDEAAEALNRALGVVTPREGQR